ncbi:hypothetical protein FRC19_005801, partial [Serendipita sp. 401]
MAKAKAFVQFLQRIHKFKSTTTIPSFLNVRQSRIASGFHDGAVVHGHDHAHACALSDLDPNPVVIRSSTNLSLSLLEEGRSSQPQFCDLTVWTRRALSGSGQHNPADIPIFEPGPYIVISCHPRTAGKVQEEDGGG